MIRRVDSSDHVGTVALCGGTRSSLAAAAISFVVNHT